MKVQNINKLMNELKDTYMFPDSNNVSEKEYFEKEFWKMYLATDIINLIAFIYYTVAYNNIIDSSSKICLYIVLDVRTGT